MVFNQGLWLVNVCGNATVVVLCRVECGGERLHVGIEKVHVGDNPTQKCGWKIRDLALGAKQAEVNGCPCLEKGTGEFSEWEVKDEEELETVQ